LHYFGNIVTNFTKINKVNAVIDIGNSRIKLGLFQNGKMIDCKLANNEDEASLLLGKIEIKKMIVSSVRKENDWINNLKVGEKKVFLGPETPLPINIVYDTPDTLGTDRIAAATGAFLRYPKKNCLVIDLGTCITYDFLDEKGNFNGGAISPGIRMRLNALHQQTSNLPLIEAWDAKIPLTGKSTKESILSGVIIGVKQEIEGFIRSYHDKVANLQIIFTGGDFKMVENLLESRPIWANHLVLEGLHGILEHNN
jgi:type III pantothenate kinase